MDAIFIVGPESSGTRMLTECFCRLGYFGDYGEHFNDDGHEQRMDDLDFTCRPDRIVFRRSYPHGDVWPDGHVLAEMMRSAGYAVRVVLIIRDKDKCVDSQKRREHETDEVVARSNIDHAITLIFGQCAEVGIWPMVIYYDAFVGSEKVRLAFFRLFGLDVPDMEWKAKVSV